MIGCRTGIYDQQTTSDPIIWFDFTDLATLNGAEVGDALVTITDKVSDFDATQATLANRPQVVADGVQFDGVDDYLSVDIVVNNPFSVIVVMDRDSTANDMVLSNAVNDYLFQLHLGNVYTSNLGSTIISTADSVTRKTISLRANDVTTVQRYNGVDTANNAFNNSSLRIQDIARYPYQDDGFYLSATIKHIVIYDKFLTNTELADVETFLNA